MSLQSYSIVQYFGNGDIHNCGYCGVEGRLDDGMWAYLLSCKDYQSLIDRGWRRCGCYCYKPVMDETCCPQYTIRCDALNFKISKSQKKVLKRFNKFLIEGQQANTEEKSESSEVAAVKEVMPDLTKKQKLEVAKFDLKEKMIFNKITTDSNVKFGESSNNSDTTVHQNKLPEASLSHEGRTPQKKAKLIRKEKQMEKLKKHGMVVQNTSDKNRAKSLEEFLIPPENANLKLEIKLVKSFPPSEEFLNTCDVSYKLYKKYQMAIHKDEEHELSLASFKKFLVTSQFSSDNSSIFGSYHQQYWLDDKLIAVGVIDILPNCVSSVYFYYDVDYRHLSLGTYAALREIAFTRELHNKYPSIKYYYLGYYIHSCPKMSYKRQFSPSYLLCPVTYTWHPIEQCLPLLDNNKYCKFSDQENSEEIDISKVVILHQEQFMDYATYSSIRNWGDNELIARFARMIGPARIDNIILCRNATCK